MKRRLHIAGSASKQCDPALLRDTQEVVYNTALAWATAGGGLVSGLGPQPAHDNDESLPILFDWRIIEAARDAVRAGAQRVLSDGPLLAIRTSRGQREQVPPENEAMLDELTDAGALDVQLLQDTWRSGALMRRAQAELGTVLVTFSGGAGVEDLANLYVERRLPVIPVDVDLGASRDDGAQGGGVGLARRALADPGLFFELRDGAAAGGRLMQLSMGERRAGSAQQSERLVRLLDDLELQCAFCVRLMNRTYDDHRNVQWFFGEIVAPVLEELGYRVVDLSDERQEEAYMDAEIFTKLHYAAMVIADTTASRPNCFIELGYALGRAHRVIATARDGEPRAFDTDKLPRFEWSPTVTVAAARAEFREHIAQYGARPPLVSPSRVV